MAHISDPHFAARVRASFERQNAMNLIMGYSSVGAVVGTTTNGRRLAVLGYFGKRTFNV
jgi:hypothetical protein